MTRELSPVLYTCLRLADGQSMPQLLRVIHTLGYELVRFCGWTDADLGMPGNRGPRWVEAQTNYGRIVAIQRAAAIVDEHGQDWPHILQVAPDDTLSGTYL